MVSMPAPSGLRAGRVTANGGVGNEVAGTSTRTIEDVLAHCLVWEQRETLTQLLREMHRAIDASARPFEVIVGSPRARFGARIAFLIAESSASRVVHELGLESHPWGAPSWVGLRVNAKGEIDWKAYHAARVVPLPLDAPPGVPSPLTPVMAALHQGRCEIYYRLLAKMPWEAFAAPCLRLVDGEMSASRLHISPTTAAFCLSIAREGRAVRAVSVFADDRALPAEPESSRLWREALPAADRAAYDVALVGVRSTGRRPARGWHAMYAWTSSDDGSQSRAVSLRIATG
jgi:hypothetical protein